MSDTLPPGWLAPPWQPDSVEQSPDERLSALIFAAAPLESRLEALTRFQARLADFGERNCRLVAVCAAPAAELSAFAQAHGLSFETLSDSAEPGGLFDRYGLLDADHTPLNALYLLDPDRRVRRVYDPQAYPDLPNPALCLRALIKIGETPRPWPLEPGDWLRGPADAPVMLIEYADYQCHPCQENHRLLSQLLAELDGRVCLVHRHLPLKPLHPLAPLAAEAAEAAGAQGRFWPMHDRLFAAEGALEREQLDQYAAEVGLNLARFAADLDSGAFTPVVSEGFRRAIKRKIKLTPVLFINGILYEGPRSLAGLHQFIDPLLARS